MKIKKRNEILIWTGITLLPYLYLIYDVGKFVRVYLTSLGGYKFNLPTETFIGFLIGFLMYCLPVLILACVFLKNKKFMRHLLLAQTVVILGSSMVVFYFIPNYYSETDIRAAVNYGNIDIAKELIKTVDIESEGGNLLFFMIDCESHNLAKYLIENGADVNYAEKEYGLTPLMLTSARGNYDLTRLLIENGADINKKDDLGQTASQSAVSSKNNEIIVDLLLRSGADVTMKDNDGWTTLIMAVEMQNDWAIIQQIIDYGAMVNDQNHEGKTALHYASQYGEWKIAGVLLKNGANSNIEDKDGNTPLSIALEEKFYAADPEVIKLMREYKD